MDHEFVKELVEVTKKNDGGTVLHVGDKAEVVVLTLDRYQQLVSGKLGVVARALAETEDKIKEVVRVLPKVLVVGGAGYIGGHVVKELLSKGFEVIVVDNLLTGRREHVPESVPFYVIDILNEEALRDVFKKHSIEAVVHLAARLEVAESVQDPAGYGDVNIIGTWILLKIMKEFGVKQIVFSSTAAAYGDGYDDLIAETAELRPNNPYGYSKVLAESLINYANKGWGLGGVIFRYFNVGGAHVDGNIGDTHLRSHLIPVVLEVAMGKQELLTVNGSDYPTFDGSCVRDFVSVVDIARAHVTALERADLSESLRTYNLGTGKGSSVLQVINAATEVVERMVPIQMGPRRPGDAASTVADSSAITRDWGFVTKHSDLSEIIKSSWDQMKKQDLPPDA